MAYAFEKLEALNEVMQLAANAQLNCTMERWSHLVSAVNEEIYWLVSDKLQARDEADKAARELVAQETMYLDKLACLRGVLDRVRKEVLAHVEGRDEVCDAVSDVLDAPNLCRSCGIFHDCPWEGQRGYREQCGDFKVKG